MRITHFLRQSLFFILLGNSFAAMASAAEALPPIDAHRFDSKPVQVSSTGRVYRFSMKSPDVPRVGNIVLFQDSNRPVMAFRVIKSDPAKKEYVGKRVRRYDNNDALTLNRSYRGVEKVADRINAPPASEIKEDLESLPEPAPVTAPVEPPAPAPTVAPTIAPPPIPAVAPRIAPRVIRQPTPAPTLAPTPEPTLAPTPEPTPEATPEPAPAPELAPAPEPTPEPTPEPVAEAPPAEIQATPAPIPTEALKAPEFDQGLDNATSPQPHAHETSMIPDDLPDEEGSAFEIEESHRLDTSHNMIAVQPGIFRNASDFVIGGELFPGVTVSYSHKLWDDWILRGAHGAQDALWLELGFANYRKAAASNDVYTVVPLRAELRWEINCSPTLTVDAYGGIQYNWIMSVDNFDPNNATMNYNYDVLSGLQPTFGIGLMFHIGPLWYIRSDLGYDRVNLGLGVKW